MEKTLTNTSPQDAISQVPDLMLKGNPNTWRLVCKAASQAEGWMRSTKAMDISNVGVVVQVSTHQRNHDGTNGVAEAVTFIPGVKLVENSDGTVSVRPY